jgi:anti-sigma B factor antagonist
MSDAAVTAPKPLMTGALLRFSHRRFNTVGTVRTAVAGEPDIAAVPQLDLTLRRAQADVRVVVLDLRELEFIDSSGARLLFAADRQAREAGGRLLIGRDAAQIDRLFVLSGVDRQLEFVDQPPAVAAPAAMEHAR